MNTIHILVTCTNTKNHEPHKRLKISNKEFFSQKEGEDALKERAALWSSAIKHVNNSEPEQKIMASDLYAGAHWSVAKNLRSRLNASNWESGLWIISAGYGLLKEDSEVVSYNAALGTGKLDSVIAPHIDLPLAESRALWWNELQQIRDDKGPRSLASLAEIDADAKFLIACSTPYLHAISNDIKLIPNFQQRVFLITQKSNDDELEFCRIGNDNSRSYSDLKSFTYGQFGHETHSGAFKGSMMSLNAQIAGFILSNAEEHRFERQMVNTAFSKLINAYAPRPHIKRSEPEGKDTEEQEETIKKDISQYLKIHIIFKQLYDSLGEGEKDTLRLFDSFRTLVFQEVGLTSGTKHQLVKIFKEFKLRIKDFESIKAKTQEDFESIRTDLLQEMKQYQIRLTPNASSALRWYRLILYKRKEEKRFRKLYEEVATSFKRE